MKKGVGIKRVTPIRPRNHVRAKKRHAEAFGPPEFGEFIRSYGCVIAREKGPLSGCGGRVEAAHVHGRANGWRENLVGLCTDHHTAGPGSFHFLGSAAAFDKHWTTDLDLWATAIYSRWLGIHQSPEPT